jgi:arabinose-5-phosphate isomerase
MAAPHATPANTRPTSTGTDAPPETWFAEGILREESRVLEQLAAAIAGPMGPGFSKAVGLLESCVSGGGSVLISGLGKSGLVGQKISATMSSLGIPAHSVHPSEAAHGDLGRFRASDTVICISHSGETTEVVNLAAILKQDGLPIISITGTPFEHAGASSLEQLATVALRLGITREAGAPQYIAPTSSTTATMALGDALALAVARRRNFTDADFARRHPGGSLGGLLRPVTDVMRFVAGKNLPVFPESMSVREALREGEKSGRRPGAMLLVDPATGRLTGLFTDGDLRRLILKDESSLDRPIASIMTRSPRTLKHTDLVRDAVTLVREFRADELPVVDDANRPVGILDVQDLIAQRLVQD